MTSSERRSGGVLCAVMPIDCAHDVGERGPAPAQAPSDGAPGGVELNGERGLFMGPLFTVLSAVGFTIASVNGAWRGQLLSALADLGGLRFEAPGAQLPSALASRFMTSSARAFGLGTTAALVVASMVGTGVFTTTGFLVRDIGNGPAVLWGWALGGVAALSGALCFGELTAALPENGGEYALLRRIYHPALGFVAAFVSLVVGFAAPVAASALAFGHYAVRAWPWLGASGLGHYLPALLPPELVLGLLLLLSSAVLHSMRVSRGTVGQNLATLLKLALILILLVAGALSVRGGFLAQPGARDLKQALLSPQMAVGLVFISYSYEGWNAAAYVAGETRQPGRTLPRALLLGTLLVTLLYVALNTLFLDAAPRELLSGKVEVAEIAATHLWGPSAGRYVAGLVALGLWSAVGALTMTGPRIYEAVGSHYPRLRWLSVRRPGGGPIAAIALQTSLAVVFAISSSFDALLEWAGLTLSILAAVTAAGVFVLRWREPGLERPYRAWGYPLTPVLFLALSSWMIVYGAVGQPLTALAAGVTLALGLLAWFAVREREV